MAKKEKKISVKHYLNKKLKGALNEETNEMMFPVYIRIRYNGAMTEIKSQYWRYSQRDEIIELKNEEITPLLSELQFQMEEKQKIFSHESNVIQSVIKELKESFRNPVSQFFPSLFTSISETTVDVMEKLIRYKIQEHLQLKHPKLVEVINWDNIVLYDFLNLVEKYFQIQDYKILLQDDKELLSFIEILSKIGLNKDVNKIKFFIPIITDENIFKLDKDQFKDLQFLVNLVVCGHLKDLDDLSVDK